MSASRQFIVGAFLLGGILLFAVGLFWIGNRRQLFSESIELYAEFRNLSGLKKGAKVRVSGLDAGEVLAIQVPPGPESKFRVRFRVLEEFGPVLRTDSVATIQTDGLVGNMILRVDVGGKAAREVIEGDTIQSREPIELSDMVQQASDTVDNLNLAIDHVKERVDESVKKLTGISTEANELIAEVTSGLERFVSTSNKVADDIEAIVENVKGGEGTVGRLLSDERIYENFTGTIGDVKQAATNMRQTTEEAKRILSELRSGGAIEDLEKTVENVRELAAQARQVLADIKPKTDEGGEGLVTDLRESIANAREATSDLAENMEAMKQNWLLRGFFKKRGFYDLDDLSVEEYRQGKFAPDRDRRRTWIHQDELFSSSPEGRQELSTQGKEKLDSVIAEYLRHASNTPLIIEGYATRGAESDQFLLSRERASRVRDYLVEKFELKPDYVGLMPMGAVESDAASDSYWEGVAIVFFPEKQKGKPQSDLRMPPSQNGFRPIIGGLPTDSGFALGVGFQETRLADGFVDLGVAAIGSYKRYEHAEIHLDLPRLWNERLFLELTTRYRNYPEENLWELGPDSRKGSRTDFRLEDADYTAAFGFRPLRGLRIGITGGILLVNTGPGKDRDWPSTELRFSAGEVPALGQQPDYLHGGAFIEYDSRDRPLDPRSGGRYLFRWAYFDDHDFDRFSFRRYEIDLRHFLPVLEKQGTIAVRALTSLTDTSPGQQAPFFMLRPLGGSEGLRGFHQHRFRDNNLLLLNVEYRHGIFSVLDLLAFGDAGKVFPETSQLGLSRLEGSVGVGGRLKVGGRVLLGTDVGWSREGVRLWVRGTHTF